MVIGTGRSDWLLCSQQHHRHSSSSYSYSRLWSRNGALMTQFSLRYRTTSLVTRGLSARPSVVRAALETASPTAKQQQAWQQALLGAMLQQHARDTAERTAHNSCAGLDTQLDAVFDGLDDIFYSKVNTLSAWHNINQGSELAWC